MYFASGGEGDVEGITEHDRDEHDRDEPGSSPAPAPGAGVKEPGALRGARRAWPQFPLPVTRLATLPRRVTTRRVAPCTLASLGRGASGTLSDRRAYRTRVFEVPLR